MHRFLIGLILPLMLNGANYSAEHRMVDGKPVITLHDAEHHAEVSIATSIGNNAYEFKVNGKNALYFPFTKLSDFEAKPTLCAIPLLAPWANRLEKMGYTFEGKARTRFGDILAEVLEAEGERAKHVEDERERFLRAPLVIGVISSAREQIKVPVWEQELSAGAACQNILIASHALGFVANWLTEWYAYHPVVKEKIGMKPGERVAGFIYIGTSSVDLEERARPEMEKIVSYF